MSLLTNAGLLLSLIAVTTLTAGEPAPPQIETHYIGYRGNGTGVFPNDCVPVTTWKQYDLKTGKDEKGKPIQVADKDKPNPVNIAWKTQLPKSLIYGNNAGVIVAGGKVFALIEPPEQGGMMAPVLCCLDPQDGTILWQTVCHHVDSLPEGIRAETLKDLAAYNDFYREWNRCGERYLGLARQLSTSYHYGPKPRTPEEKAVVEADLAKAADELKALGIMKPGTVAGGKAIKQPEKGDPPYDLIQRLVKVGYSNMIDPWIGNTACAIGRACTTPCSDGERVYVVTPFQDLFCIDLNGKILWQQYWGDGKMVGDRANYYPSPILVDGMVIRYRHLGDAKTDILSVRAFDKFSGKLLYSVPGPKTGGAYFLGVPQILTVDGVRLLSLSDGRIIRASNGEVLLEETIGYSAHGRSDLGLGNWLWTINGQDGGGYSGDKNRNMKNGEMIAHRFSWSDAGKTKLVHEIPWRTMENNGSVFGYYQGGIYHQTDRTTFGIHDAWTGTMLAKGKPNAGIDAENILIFGRDIMVASGRGPWSMVKTGDLSGLIHVDKEAMGGSGLNEWQYGPQPFLNGNRLFLRHGWTDPWVYCIGDPEEPTRLSELHTKPLPPVGK